ncbi:MAG: superoxide dismutase [Candidatus Azobacteroides sp.]|nr:superoxide dismutase [Candidatus Azobacteroides sp.]
MGKETMETHWGKHVQTYVDNVNSMVENSDLKGLSLEEIVKKSDGKLYNNAAQVWNHNLFFSLMSPTPQKAPTGELAAAINRSFGSLDAFKEAFNKTAADVFGSGWTWLIQKKDGTLEVKQTPNGNCPINEGHPLLNLDVWEHAYYLDYKNKRADYIQAFWDVLDWKAVEGRYNK